MVALRSLSVLMQSALLRLVIMKAFSHLALRKALSSLSIILYDIIKVEKRRYGMRLDDSTPDKMDGIRDGMNLLGRQNRIHNQLSETEKLLFCRVDCSAKITERVLHQKIPRDINTALFSYTLVFVRLCQRCSFLH